jgi:hypothetical protein
MQTAKKYGTRLFEAVFGDEVYGCFRGSLTTAQMQGKGLRVRLRMGAPELNDLPWEYLYNPRLNCFLSLSVDTPIVRYLELAVPIRALTVAPPLKVLAMISSPGDYQPVLDVEEEWARLSSALEPLARRGLVTLERLEIATLAALQHRLRRDDCHIFHFIGHGRFDEREQDGILVLERETGRGHQLSGQYLGTLLHNHRPLRLVILNACEGGRASRIDPFAGVAQSLVQQGIPAVIAMQFEITDEAAITFAYGFYTALADGYPVDAALVEARTAIFAQGNDIEWGTPVLYMRSLDGRLFDVAKKQISYQSRRVDAALPSQAQLGRSIDLIIVVKLPYSPILDGGEVRASRISPKYPDEGKTESKPIEIEFPDGEGTGQAKSAVLEIEVIAPDFEIRGRKRKKLSIPSDKDSELCKFLLVPLKDGELEVTVELYSRGAYIGAMTLETAVYRGSAAIDNLAVMIWRVATLPLVLVIVPINGVSSSARQPPVAMGRAAQPEHEIHIGHIPGIEPLQRRKKDIEDHLAKDQELLREWEDKLRLADDPKEKAQCREEICALKESIAAYEQELPAIAARLLRLKAAFKAEVHGQLTGLYDQAAACYRHKEWKQAVRLFEQILDIEKDYKDSSQKLVEAKRQESLARLDAEGEQAEANQDWTRAIYLYQRILDTDEDYKDVSQKLARVKEQESLGQFYAEIEQAEADQSWEQVIHLCQQILDADREYKDVSRKLVQAKRKQRWLAWRERSYSVGQRVWRFCTHYKAYVIVILVLVITVGIWRSWPSLVPPVTPTPTISGEQVKITIDGVDVSTADPQEIDCSSSSRIQVTVLNSEGVPLQPDVFSYSWRFVPPDSHNQDILDSQNYVVNYSVPCDRSNQTVTIEVLKDGGVLGVRSIRFNIENQP